MVNVGTCKTSLRAMLLQCSTRLWRTGRRQTHPTHKASTVALSSYEGQDGGQTHPTHKASEGKKGEVL